MALQYKKEKLKFIDFYYCRETSKIEVMLDYFGFVGIVYLSFYTSDESFKKAKCDDVAKLSWMTDDKWFKNYIKNLKSFKEFLHQLGIEEKLEITSFDKGLEEKIIEKIGCLVDVYTDGESFRF